MTDFASFKNTRDAIVSRLRHVLYERSPKKLAQTDAHKLAKRVAKKIAIRETAMAQRNGLRGTRKQASAIARFRIEMVDVIKAANTGDFDLSVASVMGIRKKQMAARNARLLEQHTEAVLAKHSASELAQLAMRQENTNGKGGMAPGHTPASSE